MKHPRDIIANMRRDAHKSAYLTKWGQREAAGLNVRDVNECFGRSAAELYAARASGRIVGRMEGRRK